MLPSRRTIHEPFRRNTNTTMLNPVALADEAQRSARTGDSSAGKIHAVLTSPSTNLQGLLFGAGISLEYRVTTKRDSYPRMQNHRI